MRYFRHETMGCHSWRQTVPYKGGLRGRYANHEIEEKDRKYIKVNAKVFVRKYEKYLVTKVPDGTTLKKHEYSRGSSLVYNKHRTRHCR